MSPPVIPARQNRIPCRRADRRRRMPVGKDHSLLRNPIDVRRRNLRFRIQSGHITKALIIGHDENNIWLCVCSMAGCGHSAIQNAENDSDVSHYGSHERVFEEFGSHDSRDSFRQLGSRWDHKCRIACAGIWRRTRSGGDLPRTFDRMRTSFDVPFRSAGIVR